MNSKVQSPSSSESGQAAALVALLLFFAFLGFASLAIDGAMTYSVRRDLQNVADSATLAACRVIASNDTSTTPLAAAENAIATHLGSWTEFAGSNPPMTNEGAGASLLKGIEVSEPEVRVALQRRVPTVLTQFLGRGDSIMVAQARCDSRAGGGLLPIAVPRYLVSEDTSVNPPNPPYTDFVAKKGAPIYPSDSVTVTWDGHYGPFDVPVPTSPWIAADGALADSNTGPEVLLLGSSADTNNGENNMRNLVLLDVRDVATDPPEFYNGADSQADAAKYMSRDWIRQHGYPGPFPDVGSQVAILDGASNDFTEHAMINDAEYRPGDAIAAIIYDGFVWQRPDFVVTWNPQSGSGIVTGYPIDASTSVAYDLRIDKGGNAPWYAPQNFTVQLVFNNAASLPPDMHVTIDGAELAGPNYAHTVNNVTDAGWGGTVRIWSTYAITVGQYLSGIDIIATNTSSTGQVRGPDPATSSYVQFGFWNGANIAADYTARTSTGKVIIWQGGNFQTDLIAYGVGTNFPSSGGGTCRDVPVIGSVLLGGTVQPWGSFFSSSAGPYNLDIKNTSVKSINFPLNAAPLIVGVGSNYTLRLTVGPKTCSNGQTVPQHIVDIPLEIKPPPATNAPITKFVIIQGYAVFRVSRNDANDVWGYAISPLYERFEDITYGLRPRLVPWY